MPNQLCNHLYDSRAFSPVLLCSASALLTPFSQPGHSCAREQIRQPRLYPGEPDSCQIDLNRPMLKPC